MGKEDNAPDGIQIGDAEDNLNILELLTEAGDDNSNASDKSFKHNESYQKEFDDQLKEESRFMKTTVDKSKSDDKDKMQGEYISHEEQKDYFFKPPQQDENNNEDENSETGSDRDVHDSVELAII